MHAMYKEDLMNRENKEQSEEESQPSIVQEVEKTDKER